MHGMCKSSGAIITPYCCQMLVSCFTKINLVLRLICSIKEQDNLHKNLLGNGQWRAVDSIKHCEKQLPLK